MPKYPSWDEGKVTYAFIKMQVHSVKRLKCQMMLHKTSLLPFLRREDLYAEFSSLLIPKGEDKWHHQGHHLAHMPFSFQSQSHGKPKSHCYVWSHKKEHNLEKQKSSVAGLIFFSAVFKMESLHVAQDGPGFLIMLPQPPKHRQPEASITPASSLPTLN